MTPQLRSVLAKVLEVRYHGKDDPKYVIGALVCIAAEPNFPVRLSIESMRALKKLLSEALNGSGDLSEWMKDPARRAVVEQYSLAQSWSIRRSNGRNQEPLLPDIDE